MCDLTHWSVLSIAAPLSNKTSITATWATFTAKWSGVLLSCTFSQHRQSMSGNSTVPILGLLVTPVTQVQQYYSHYWTIMDWLLVLLCVKDITKQCHTKIWKSIKNDVRFHPSVGLMHWSTPLQQHLHNGCVTIQHCRMEWSHAILHMQSASRVSEWQFSNPDSGSTCDSCHFRWTTLL